VQPCSLSQQHRNDPTISTLSCHDKSSTTRDILDVQVRIVAILADKPSDEIVSSIAGSRNKSSIMIVGTLIIARDSNWTEDPFDKVNVANASRFNHDPSDILLIDRQTFTISVPELQERKNGAKLSICSSHVE